MEYFFLKGEPVRSSGFHFPKILSNFKTPSSKPTAINSDNANLLKFQPSDDFK